jgi:hypothetical protein
VLHHSTTILLSSHSCHCIISSPKSSLILLISDFFRNVYKLIYVMFMMKRLCVGTTLVLVYTYHIFVQWACVVSNIIRKAMVKALKNNGTYLFCRDLLCCWSDCYYITRRRTLLLRNEWRRMALLLLLEYSLWPSWLYAYKLCIAQSNFK